jgi:5'-AMP-activated protein kinase catalytic alpha subunit
MTCGYLPFEDPNTSALYKKILNCEYKCPKFVSPAVKDLIAKILNTDPELRYTIHDIRQHSWTQMVKV